jgi:peptidoglycan/LPS O-acetylase OafA/YrhL
LKQRDVEILLLIWIIGMLTKQYYPAMMFSSYLPPLWTHLGIYVAGYYVYNYCVGGKFLKISTIMFVLLCVLNISTNCAIGVARHLATIFLGMICLNISFKDEVQQSILGRITINISRYSYTIYLLHILFIRAIYMLTESYFSNALIVWVPLFVTPFVVLFFYVGCRTYDKIKWLPNNLVGIG